MEVDFFNRGGLLVVGTDPTGYGSWRAIELLVEAGLPPIDAIKCATSNGAQLLGITKETGTIEVGKAADLIIVNGKPDKTIADLRKTETVFKDGIGYDSATLFNSVAGMVGIQLAAEFLQYAGEDHISAHHEPNHDTHEGFTNDVAVECPCARVAF